MAMDPVCDGLHDGAGIHRSAHCKNYRFNAGNWAFIAISPQGKNNVAKLFSRNDPITGRTLCNLRAGQEFFIRLFKEVGLHV